MPTQLALFDLDNTLLPIDTDHEWVLWLAKNGHAGDPQEVQRKNDELMEKYHAGVLKIEESAQFMLSFLHRHTPAKLAYLHEQFMHEVVRPTIKKSAVDLVDYHLQQGDLCCLVSATNTFVITPVARAFGFEHIIGTVPEYKNGRYTGKVVGEPSYKEGKVHRVDQWLASLGHTLQDFEDRYFYSDSINDLPLLEEVNHPVATNPSQELRDLALARDWSILDLFVQPD